MSLWPGCHVDTANEDSALGRQCNNATGPLSADRLTNVACRDRGRGRGGGKGSAACRD